MFAKLLIALIRVYQSTLSLLILGAFGPVCRFDPSCSRYAVACIQGHGALRGSLLSVKRLCRCHPFHPGGFDPPPPPRHGSGPPLPAQVSGLEPRLHDGKADDTAVNRSTLWTSEAPTTTSDSGPAELAQPVPRQGV
jgi:uncharacterized protein